MIRDLQRNHPTVARDVMRTTRVRSKVERSRACAPLTKTSVWDSGFFAHARFVPKTPNVMGFSGSVNGTTKNPRFLDFGFCQCTWAYVPIIIPLLKPRTLLSTPGSDIQGFFKPRAKKKLWFHTWEITWVISRPRTGALHIVRLAPQLQLLC